VKSPSEDARAASFADLFRRTRTDLLAYLARRAGNPEDAADLLAETYLVAWRRLDAIPEGEQARLWLFGVARNLLLKRAGRQHAADVLVARLADELRATQQQRAAVADDRQQLVLRALARLSERDREILTLAAWEGLTPAEIAAVTGTSPNLVRVRLHRARVRLQRKLRPSLASAARYGNTVAFDPERS
jgi:RNA polymerase sigma-70 factor (ECF subfamily)